MKKLLSILTVILTVWLPLSAQTTPSAAYVHTTNACNISGAYTRLNQVDINGKPNAHIQVTPVFPSQNKVVGVEYDGKFWYIVNEDNSAMASGISFNVVVINDNVSNGTLISNFVHQVTANNSRSNITNSAANANNTNKLFLTNNRTASNGGTVANNKRTQLRWDSNSKQFYLQHDVFQNGAYTPLTLNARYNVLALQQNTTNFRTLSAATAINAAADAIILVQRIESPTEFDAPNLTVPLSVRYDAAARNWRVYEGAQTASLDRYVNVAIFSPNRVGIVDATPNSPSKLNAVSNSPTQIIFSWGSSSGAEDSYEVEYSLNSNFNPIIDKTITLSATTTTYTFDGLTPNTRYYFRVRGINQSINRCVSGYSTTSATTQAAPIITPVAPTNLTATAPDHTSINLTWTDASNNETGFEIERSTDGTTFTRIDNVAAGVTTYLSTGLAASTRYWYRVRATNTAGNSPYSNTANATTQAAPVTIPAAPTNLTATATDHTRINLTWTDASNNETGFEIERSTDGTTFTRIDNVAAGVTTYSSTGLAASTRYWYRVRATNTAGNSPYSNTANATTALSSELMAPINLTANPFPLNQVILNWEYRSTGGSGFEIWRAVGQDNEYTLLGEVPLNVRTFTEQNLRQQSVFFYKVRAKRSPDFSPFSNVARATTPVVTSIVSFYPENIIVFPNPVQNTLNIGFRATLDAEMSFQLISNEGRELIHNRVSTHKDIQIAVEHLPAGMYYLKLSGKQQQYQTLIFKQ